MRKLAVMRGDRKTGYVGNWINAVPCQALGTKMDSATCITSCRWWSGKPTGQAETCSSRSRNGKVCIEELDRWGDHAVSCKVGPGVIGRHDAVNNLWCGMARGAGLHAVKEQRIDAESRKRPADTLVLGWKGTEWCAQDRVVGHVMTKEEAQPQCGCGEGRKEKRKDGERSV